MTELEMYELWRTLRLWANYNQLNQTIEKNWLSNSFNSHMLRFFFPTCIAASGPAGCIPVCGLLHGASLRT